MATSFPLCSNPSTSLVSYLLLSTCSSSLASSNPFTFVFSSSNPIYGYRYQYYLEALPCISKRLLQVQRHKPSGKGLLLPDGHKTINGRTTGGADRRSLGFERCSFQRREPSGRGGFCIIWPVNNAPQFPLINRFCILNIEESNTSICKPIVIPSSSSAAISMTQRLKWKKKLLKQLSISVLDIYRASLILNIELCTIDTSKVHSVKTLLNCRATGSFTDRDFVYNKKINTWSISYPISMFNIDGISNKAEQISKVIDIVL